MIIRETRLSISVDALRLGFKLSEISGIFSLHDLHVMRVKRVTGLPDPLREIREG